MAVEVDVDLVTEQPVTGQQVPEASAVVDTALPVDGHVGVVSPVIGQAPSVLPVMGQQVEPSVEVQALVRPVTGQEVVEQLVELPVTGQAGVTVVSVGQHVVEHSAGHAVVEQPSELQVAGVVVVVLESDILVYLYYSLFLYTIFLINKLLIQS